MTKPDSHRDPDAAAEMAANTVLRLLRECGAPDKNAWIAKVVALVNERKNQVN